MHIRETYAVRRFRRIIRFFRQITLFVALLVLIPAMFYSFFLAGVNVNMPQQANQAAGLPVPFQLKGITVYLTEKQYRLTSEVHTIELLSAIVVVLSLILNEKWPIDQNNQKGKPD